MSDFNRREFLHSVVVTAGGLAVGSKLAGCADLREAPAIADGFSYFPQSVASGDPKPNSVILWTRVADSLSLGQDLSLDLYVARDRAFQDRVVEQRGLPAKAAHDNALKVKLVGLDPRTTYYYRFVYTKDRQTQGSQIGRTKTAPAPGDDVPVRFAVINCNDYIGRYFNTLMKLANDPGLDFVIHLGDCIYETTGDPRFQQTSPTRVIEFTDAAGAIDLGDHQAAKSVDNYRQLYRTYRGDQMMQRVHEQNAMINIWDDHEYSNDCWGATAVYSNGRRNEHDEERRRNAEQVFFEYVPMDDDDVAQGPVETPTSKLYPNARIYRDFHFGKHVHLVMTDYRSYRPDHLVAEDAFPGTVVVDEATLTALGLLSQFPSEALFGYVDIDGAAFASTYKPVLTGVLTQGYIAEGLAQADAAAKAAANISGNINALVANGLVQKYNDTSPPQPLPAIDTAGLPRGVAIVHMGKQDLFSSLGARDFVVKDTYELYAAVKYQATAKASENALGTDQETWLQSTLTGSTATWKLLGSSVSFVPAQIDLRGLPIPSAFQQRFIVTADDWDGFPNKRKEMLEMIGAIPGAVVLSGDIHAGFVTEHPLTGGGKLIEFTGPATSSSPLRDEILSIIAESPTLSAIPGVEQIVSSFPDFMRAVTGNQLRLLTLEHQGYYIVEANGQTLSAQYHLVEGNESLKSYYGTPDAYLGKFTILRFTIAGGVLQ